MVYSNKYVVSVLVDGEIMPERKDGSVIIQFGTEYVLRLRNKNDHRCVCKIFIDDENVSGGGYIIDANQYIEIERFNNINRKFKLVKPDSPEAADYGKGPRKDGSNGVIRCEFYPEKKKAQQIKEYIPYPVRPFYPLIPRSPYDLPAQPVWTNSAININSVNARNNTLGLCDDSIQTAKEGVTVEGGQSEQSFYKVQIDIENTATILTLKLMGQEDEPKAKTEYCRKCGTKVSRKINFCPICGLRL